MDLSTTHVHLILNHVPTIAYIIAIGLFVSALIARSDHLSQASLVLFAGIALVTIPVYVTGNSAAEAICVSEPGEPDQPCADPAISRPLIELHEGAAAGALLAIVVTGGLAWLGLWQYRRRRRIAAWNTVAILMVSMVTLGLVSRAANLGGEIRHPEIRLAQEAIAAGPTLADVIVNVVRDRPWIWIASETLHFIGLSVLIGALLLIHLRTLGVLTAVSFDALERLLPWAAAGFGVNVVTGMLFFIASPSFYTTNQAFFWKLVFVMAAGANTLYFFFDRGWTDEAGAGVRWQTKLVTASALLLWVGVMYWGSMLPFLGNSF
jgi:hypothetical protein